MKYNIDNLLEEASRKLGVSTHEIEYFSWPQTFGSTAGPGGGIGGSVMTDFQIFAFRIKGQLKGIQTCANYWRPWSGQLEEYWR